MKLKEWKAKRDQSFDARSVTSNGHSVRLLMPVQQPAILNADQVKTPTFPDVDIDIDWAPLASLIPDNLSMCSAAPLPSLTLSANLFDQFSWYDRDALYEFPLSSFVDGKNCVLHTLAASTLRSDLVTQSVRQVIGFMAANGISIDLRNHKSSTALESAICAGRLDLVEMVLAAGASLSTTNLNGEEALHVALASSSPDKIKICNLLLKHGADPTAVVVSKLGEGDISTTGVLFNHLARATPAQRSDDCELIAACLVQDDRWPAIYNTLGRSDDFGERIGHGLQRFLASWSTPIFSDSATGTRLCDKWPMECLKAFLQRGCDPFVPGSAGYICTKGFCKTFAQFAFFHAVNPLCARILVDECDDKHLWKLLLSLFRPCPGRYRGQPVPSPSQRLAGLLQKRMPLQNYQTFLGFLLHRCPKTEQEKPHLLRTLLSSGKVDVHVRDNVGRRPLEYLLCLEEDQRWQAAEILLSKDVLDIDSWSGDLDSSDEPHDIFLRRSDGPALYSHAGYLGYLERYFGPEEPSVVADTTLPTLPCCCRSTGKLPLPHESVLELQRCVIHVITKLLLAVSSPFAETMPPMERVASALRMRRGFRLPEIHISTASLAEFF